MHLLSMIAIYILGALNSEILKDKRHEKTVKDKKRKR